MTLEPERDNDVREPKRQKRFYGSRRTQRAIERSHRRELKALKDRESLGTGLTDKERNRLELLRDVYE